MQNNTITLPEELQSQMEAAAIAEGRSLTEVYTEAAQRYLAHRHLDDLGRRGHAYAVAQGRKPSDVLRLIEESRRGR
jgi:hypothetical protein